MRIFHNMLYRVRCTRTFRDGNMPKEFMSFTADKIYDDIPGNVLKRLMWSDPDAFEPLEQKIPPSDGKPNITPSAKKLLDEFPIPIEDIEPTGKDGTILKSDVEKYLAE